MNHGFSPYVDIGTGSSHSNRWPTYWSSGSNDEVLIYTPERSHDNVTPLYEKGTIKVQAACIDQQGRGAGGEISLVYLSNGLGTITLETPDIIVPLKLGGGGNGPLKGTAWSLIQKNGGIYAKLKGPDTALEALGIPFILLWKFTGQSCAVAFDMSF